MMRSIPIGLRIILIYIIVKLFNCLAYAEPTKTIQAALSHQQSDITSFSTFGIHTNDELNARPYADEARRSVRLAEQLTEERKSKFSSDVKSTENYFNYDSGKFESIDKALRSKRGTERVDICAIAECKCRPETKFLTVDCHFQQHFKFDEKKFIRLAAETLLVKLSSNAEFSLDGNILEGNRLNRIMIEGTGFDGREHVEINSNAFNGNNGPFPEISIVGVHNVVIRSNAFYLEFQLNITNCAKVSIFPEAFANTSFHGYFENIRDFQLQERAFSKSRAKVLIQNSRMDELQRLDASLKEIKFCNTYIGEIKTNAFDVLNLDSIVFDNCQINTIQSNALTEKLLSNYFALTGCNIGSIETKAISGSGIREVLISNNSITNIKQKALTITSLITALIQSNNISITERFWFRVNEWSNVTIESNHFGVYQQVGIEITKNPSRCVFENNYITKTVPDSLNFKSPHCRVKQVSFDQSCSCNSTYFRQLSYNDISSESYCKIDKTLTHCFNATLYNLKAYRDDICDDSAQIDCVRDRINAKSNGYFIDLNRLLNPSEKLMYLYIGGGILLIILSIILIIMICRRCSRRKKVFDESPMRDIALMESLHPTTATLTAQRYYPTFDTFTHSDMLVINQILQDMKQTYPPESYENLYNNTQKLIIGNLTESDKVKTIGEIVQCIDECENTGTDFVAFTDILYKHLGSGEQMTTHQVTGPIYAEPSLTRLDVLPTNVDRHTELNAIEGAIGGNGEHIYAEPMNLQQPLLRNEYNVPIDHNDNNSHTYVEPVTGDIDYVSSPRQTNATGSASANKNFDPSHLYAKPSTSAKHRNNIQHGPLFLARDTPKASTSFSSENRSLPKISNFKNSAHSSSQESNSSHSDHSGGSGATLPLDEPIEYADA